MKYIISFLAFFILSCGAPIDIYDGPFAPETSPVDVSGYSNIIFDGDSICAQSPFNQFGLNYAVPGSMTYDVLSRQASYSVSDDECFVLWIGTNNFAKGREVHDFLESYIDICSKYKNVVIISVLPRPAFNSERNGDIDKLNYNLYILCQRYGWSFINIHNYYDSHSELFSDGTHLVNEDAYDYILTQIIF